jgi:hypothetical protein
LKIHRILLTCLALLLLAVPAAAAAAKSDCALCHQKLSPGLVKDFLGSRHAQTMDCSGCHGAAHKSEKDVSLAKLPTAETCRECHEAQYARFAAGKHALAWKAMEATPTSGLQPHAFLTGLKGCGGCHKIGLRQKGSEQTAEPYGSPCDSCHTRHRFSAKEAANPAACRTCHMGFDHPQWEMWSGSKHGVIYQIEGPGRAPACQTCHMSEGDHRVMTAWGFLGLRLPEPDAEWLGWRATILKGIGVLSPEGQPTARLEAVKSLNIARLTAEGWQEERSRMVAVCTRCHSGRLVKTNLAYGDAMLREADQLMAEGIAVVAGLYKDGLLKGAGGYPDILTFYDAKTPIEQTLYVMFLEHRNRTFQGAFHNNPDYATWYGLAELRRDLVEIKAEAERIRGQK